MNYVCPKTGLELRPIDAGCDGRELNGVFKDGKEIAWYYRDAPPEEQILRAILICERKSFMDMVDTTRESSERINIENYKIQTASQKYAEWHILGVQIGLIPNTVDTLWPCNILPKENNVPLPKD